MAKRSPPRHRAGESAGWREYRLDEDTPDHWELFTMPINGGERTRLHPPLSDESRITVPQAPFSPDSAQVLYRWYIDDDVREQLWTSSVDGLRRVQLNHQFEDGERQGKIRVVEYAAITRLRRYEKLASQVGS